MTDGGLQYNSGNANDLEVNVGATGIQGTLAVANGGTGTTSLGELSGTNGLTVTGGSAALVSAASIALDATHTGITSILNGSLKVGADANNHIDFSGGEIAKVIGGVKKLHVQSSNTKFNHGSSNLTGSISSSGTTVTGAGGANFTSELQSGDVITAGGQTRTVQGITNSTTLTTTEAFNPALSAGTAYTKLVATLQIENQKVKPAVHDDTALGEEALCFTDLYLSHGANIYFRNSGNTDRDAAIVHSAGAFTFRGSNSSNYSEITASACTVASDANLKQDITVIDPQYALNAVNAMQPTEWNWKDNKQKSSGIIAQQLQEVDAVSHLVKNDSTLSVNYNGMSGYLIGAIHALTAEIAELKKRV